MMPLIALFVGVSILLMKEKEYFQKEIKMTREEAIDTLKNGLWWDRKQLDEAIDIAVSALRPVSRERVKKMFPGCKYCTNDIKSRKKYTIREYPGLCNFEVFLDGFRNLTDIAVNTYNHQTPFTEDIYFSFPISYCPYCSCPLTEEAVQMMIERMEALKDG